MGVEPHGGSWRYSSIRMPGCDWLAGLALLLAVVLLNPGQIRGYLVFSPQGFVEKLQAFCAKATALWTVVALATLLPAYLAGANYYTCGKPHLRATIAFLYSSVMAEWSVAVGTCLFFGTAGYLVMELRSESRVLIAGHSPKSEGGVPELHDWLRQQGHLSLADHLDRMNPVAPMETASKGLIARIESVASKLAQESKQLEADIVLSFISALPQSEKHTWHRKAGILAIWMLVVGVFSVPSWIFAIGTSLPGDHNTLGISARTLQAFQHSAGAMLSATNSFAMPLLARWVTRAFSQGEVDRSTELILMMGGRLAISLIVPVLAVIILDQQCFAQWLKFWDGCQSPDAFNIEVLSHSVIAHADVCNPGYASSGFCSRAVVSTVGDLILSKLVFSAFVTPPLFLLQCTRHFRRFKEWIVHNIFGNHEYKATRSVDREVAGITMLLEYPIVLGCCVPMVLPLVCITLLQSTAAFHFARTIMGAEFSDEATPSTVYLWFATILGMGLASWTFFDCDFNGKYLVLVGAPGLLVGGAAWSMLHRQAPHGEVEEKDAFLASLQTPFLEEDRSYNEDTRDTTVVLDGYTPPDHEII